MPQIATPDRHLLGPDYALLYNDAYVPLLGAADDLPGPLPPLAEGVSGQWIAPAGEIPRPCEEGLRKRPLVLCADDNADLRCYVSRLLAPLYDVIAVADGEQALETALIYRSAGGLGLGLAIVRSLIEMHEGR